MSITYWVKLGACKKNIGVNFMTDEEITNIIFVREEPIHADLAMIFGASNVEELTQRVQQGVKLYKEGFVPKLMVTGGGDLARREPEAKTMCDIAYALGIPEKDMLIENKSTNTFENASYSADILRNCGLLDKISTILLVSSEWHVHRVRLIMRKYFPADITLICCPTLQGATRENWLSSENYKKRVRTEASLLEAFLKAGSI